MLSVCYSSAFLSLSAGFSYGWPDSQEFYPLSDFSSLWGLCALGTLFLLSFSAACLPPALSGCLGLWPLSNTPVCISSCLSGCLSLVYCVCIQLVDLEGEQTSVLHD